MNKLNLSEDHLALTYDPDEIIHNEEYLYMRYKKLSARNKAYVAMLRKGYTHLSKEQEGPPGKRIYIIRMRSPNWRGPTRILTIDELREADGMPGVQKLDSLQKNLYG